MDGGDASARSKVWVGKRGSPAVARLGPKNEWASCLVVKTLKDQGQVLLLADNGDEVTVAAHEVRLREGEYHPVTLSKEDAKQRAMRFTCHAAMTAQRFFRALLDRKRVGYMRAAVKAATVVEAYARGMIARREAARRRKANAELRAAVYIQAHAHVRILSCVHSTSTC